MKIVHYSDGLSLVEYLTKEQELVGTVQEPTLFTWVVAPTVIYGRHQSAEVEVNKQYCRQKGITIVQRKSGGGCVYADEGNLMISLVSPSAHNEDVFAQFLNMISGALNEAGLPAVTTEHNDILIDGKKVSGCACYTTSTGTIVHGTLLFDVDLEALEQAITPTNAKLAKHGVASVRQRVTNIKTKTDKFADIQALRLFIEQYAERY